MGSAKAENAAEKVRVLVRTEAPKPSKATAPSGKGCVMMPTIVARKIARSCQAGLETPEGTGTNQRMTPVAMEASNGFIAAPCHGCGAGVIEEGDGDADADALTVNTFKLLQRFGRTLVGDLMENFGTRERRRRRRFGFGFGVGVDLWWEREKGQERHFREGRELNAREVHEEGDARARDAIFFIIIIIMWRCCCCCCWRCSG